MDLCLPFFFLRKKEAYSKNEFNERQIAGGVPINSFNKYQINW